LKLFFEDVELTASGVGVSKGEESGDFSECGRDAGVSGPSDDGVVPLNRDNGPYGESFGVFEVCREIVSPHENAIACCSPLTDEVDEGCRCVGRRLVVYPKGQELVMDRGRAMIFKPRARQRTEDEIRVWGGRSSEYCTNLIN